MHIVQIKTDIKKVLVTLIVCYIGFDDFHQLGSFLSSGLWGFFQLNGISEDLPRISREYLAQLEQQQEQLKLATNPQFEGLFEGMFTQFKNGEWSLEELCQAMPNGCDDENVVHNLKLVMGNPDLVRNLLKEFVTPNYSVIVKAIEEEKEKIRKFEEEQEKGHQNVNTLIRTGFFGLLVHVTILMYLCHALLSENYNAVKKSAVYFATLMFYYNIDVRYLGFRPSSTFSEVVSDSLGNKHLFVVIEQEKNIVVGLIVLGIFMIFTSYFFPDNNRTFNPKNGLTNKQLKKLKNKSNLSSIHEYCAKGQVDKMKEVIRNHRQDININASDKNGNIPLHLAVTRDQLKIVTLIASEFEDEVDASLRDSEGYDALDLAITKNIVKPSMIVHEVLRISNTASLSSLTLALKTNQDNVLDKLISKTKDSSLTSDPSLKDALIIFQKSLSESKQRNLKSDQKESIKRNLEIQRGLIVNRLEAIQSDKPETWKNEFECPICHEDMKPPVKIFACVNDHYLCSDCLNKDIKICPMCRDNFDENPPTRRPLAEKWNA